MDEGSTHSLSRCYKICIARVSAEYAASSLTSDAGGCLRCNKNKLSYRVPNM